MSTRQRTSFDGKFALPWVTSFFHRVYSTENREKKDVEKKQDVQEKDDVKDEHEDEETKKVVGEKGDVEEEEEEMELTLPAVIWLECDGKCAHLKFLIIHI